MSDALTWEELADLYDEVTEGTARIQPMDKIFEWGKSQGFLKLNEDEGTLHKTKGRFEVWI